MNKMLLEEEIIDMMKDLIVTLYFSNKMKVYIYNNGLGLLPTNLTNYCDLDLVLKARALQLL